jgi:3-oxoacyl-[acyl-carrier protein] reductase
MNVLDFSGKTALVVGGSSGIGNAIAQAFRERGADVHVWGTRASAAAYQGAEGSNLDGLHYERVDAAEFDAVMAYQPQFKKLDLLVLSQGIVLYKRAEFTLSGFTKVVDINLNSVMACASRFHDMLTAAQGCMIVISSTAAYHSTRGNPGYNASKSGCVGLTRTLADAWAQDGIRVNGIAPGMVETKLTTVTTRNPDRLASALERIPLNRLGTPEEIANVALFLASPLASYVIGQTIRVDGGAGL